MANYQFKTIFTIKSGYLISQLINCMDKTNSNNSCTQTHRSVYGEKKNPQ